MTDARPLVTVVTPSFNYARYIGQCLASVAGQTYPRIEHLVLDACSTDGTAHAIAPFLGAERLRVFVEKDGGQADAIQRGLAHGQGEILCWLNADDYWLHDSVIEEAVQALEAGADVVTAGGCFVDASGARLEPWRVPTRRVLTELRFHDTVLQPATFWRRAVHQPLRQDLHYAFDWRLWLDLRAAGARFEVLDREWAAYRLHGTNKTSSDPAARRGEIAQILASTCGRASPQHLWARAVYGGFRLAERLDSRAAKRAVQLANIGMLKLTRRRVFSC